MAGHWPAASYGAHAGQWDRAGHEDFRRQCIRAPSVCADRRGRCAGPAAKLRNAAGPAGVAPVPWGRTAPEPEDVEGRLGHAITRMGGITRCRRAAIRPSSNRRGWTGSGAPRSITSCCDLVTVSTRLPWRRKPRVAEKSRPATRRKDRPLRSPRRLMRAPLWHRPSARTMPSAPKLGSRLTSAFPGYGSGHPSRWRVRSGRSAVLARNSKHPHRHAVAHPRGEPAPPPSRRAVRRPVDEDGRFAGERRRRVLQDQFAGRSRSAFRARLTSVGRDGEMQRTHAAKSPSHAGRAIVRLADHREIVTGELGAQNAQLHLR